MPLNISGVLGGLSSLIPPSSSPTRSQTTPESGADFGSALKQAVSALGQLGAQADSSSLKLAQGDPIDVHEVMLNTEQASLGFSMAVQVRNKLVDAYDEIMKMSI